MSSNGTTTTIPTTGIAFTSSGFPAPIQGYDIHVYFFQSDPSSLLRAKSLHTELRQSFPQLTVYDVIPKPVGPHATGMFQAYIHTPEEFALVVPWISLNRHGLSILVHPHTGDHVKDHSEHAIWIGERLPVNLDILRQLSQPGQFVNWVKS